MQLYRRACSKLPAFLLIEACMHGDVEGKRTRELCQGPHFSPAMIHTQCSAHSGRQWFPPPPPPDHHSTVADQYSALPDYIPLSVI